MDRNFPGMNTISYTTASLSARRAWIEIGAPTKQADKHASLSARRAWIEIRRFLASLSAVVTSLSARRAWIEIADYVEYNYNNNVALRKESVDRNLNSIKRFLTSVGRSPQGERG